MPPTCLFGVYTQCVPGLQFEVQAAARAADRVCAPFMQCTLGVTFETAAPTGFTERVCVSVSECDPLAQLEVNLPTLVSDRVCAPLLWTASWPFHGRGHGAMRGRWLCRRRHCH